MPPCISFWERPWPPAVSQPEGPPRSPCGPRVLPETDEGSSVLGKREEPFGSAPDFQSPRGRGVGRWQSNVMHVIRCDTSLTAGLGARPCRDVSASDAASFLRGRTGRCELLSVFTERPGDAS